MSKSRIAIVVQRYGAEVNGGAEQMARWVAEKLVTLADVEVITTCALDYQSWADHYPAGTSTLNGVILHRFPVDQPRDWQQAQQATYEIVNFEHDPTAEWAWIKEQGPYSTPMLEHIEKESGRYDLYFFFTYLYAPTRFGLPKVKEKAIFVPCAHDEATLYLSIFKELFHAPRFIAYNTESEKRLVEHLFGNQAVPNMVIGTGVTVPTTTNEARFRTRYGVEGAYLLYAGRIAPSKNVPELLDFFQRFRSATESNLKLVLLGRATIDIPDDPAIIATGFVSEEEKYDAIAGAEIVVIPSKFESLSIITLEAWLLNRPVLVNGDCQLLRDLVQLSNGGLYYTSFPEFQLTLKHLLDNPNSRQHLGQMGGEYAQTHYSWSAVMKKYRALLATMITSES